ncbi:type VII secretion system-associated protein [Actinopolyspora mortivallis]|uniref:type VII secretion system-associated protein n=1 Tax=Actinopolyspora mortivallis TaxID=33906 RepID=UPI00037ABD41|nr:type VII secretion system-associated protein [Actinopolyspora mortivallis]
MSEDSVPSYAPQITDEMREQAKRTPDSWLYIVDPAYEAAGENVPPEGVVGAFRIDANGEIDEDFHPNEEYEPKAPTIDPVNELERVLERISTGNAPETELPTAVLAGEVVLYAEHDGDEDLYEAELDDGSRLVPACTSEQRVPEDWPSHRTVPGDQLPRLLGGIDLGLNLDDPIRAVIPYDMLVDAATEQ